MANFRKRSHGWNVQIRRSGFPNLYKTFRKKEDAQAWAREVELRIQRDELNIFPESSVLYNIYGASLAGQNQFSIAIEKYKKV